VRVAEGEWFPPPVVVEDIARKPEGRKLSPAMTLALCGGVRVRLNREPYKAGETALSASMPQPGAMVDVDRLKPDQRSLALSRTLFE
jgi:hypothetical protein